MFLFKKTQIPKNEWHSFDSTPWLYPWLTKENITTFREFSDRWLDKLETAFDTRGNYQGKRYGFVGNMANNSYVRASAISHRNLHIDLFVHPQDRNLMSQPGWEEYDGEVPIGVSTLEDAIAAGVLLPKVDCLRDDIASATAQETCFMDLSKGMRKSVQTQYAPYLSSFIPILRILNQYDALFSIQVPYLAYLSGAPYCVSQMGGEIWYECSRNDLHGILQRNAYKHSKVFLFSNPWSLAFARRYNFYNLIYVPLLINENQYSPGRQEYREEWKIKTGGSFFVLMTSRLDEYYKGTDIALDGFAKFSNINPDARLVLIGWGQDFDKNFKEIKNRGLKDKVLVLPMVGKLRLIKFLRSADCVLDQISFGYYGGSALEAMACGKPVIMKIEDSQYKALLPEGPPPVCNVTNSDDVFKSLVRLSHDELYKNNLGTQAREWFMSTHSNKKWGKYYEALLWGVAQNALPKFTGSPLKGFRSINEKKYLETELKNAPIFPNYR